MFHILTCAFYTPSTASTAPEPNNFGPRSLFLEPLRGYAELTAFDHQSVPALPLGKSPERPAQRVKPLLPTAPGDGKLTAVSKYLTLHPRLLQSRKVQHGSANTSKSPVTALLSQICLSLPH